MKDTTPELPKDASNYDMRQNLSPGDLLFNMRWNVYLARGTPAYVDRIKDLQTFIESHPKVKDDKEYREAIQKAEYEKPDPVETIRALRTPGADPAKVKMIKEIDWDLVLYAIDQVCGKHNLTWVTMDLEII